MKDKVGFDGIGEVVATFYAGEGVEKGHVVKVSGESEAAPCAAGERFCGVSVGGSQGYAAVQMAGFVTVECGDEAVEAGYVTLTADGKGGVKKAGTGDKGREYLVVEVGNGLAVIYM